MSPTLPIYIISCNKTARILPLTVHLYNKYWQLPGVQQQFIILGQDKPTFGLPDNFSFFSFTQDNDITVWTREIYRYIKDHEKSDYFILTLDDYVPNGPLVPEVWQTLWEYTQRHATVGRAALGRLDIETWDGVESKDSYEVVKLRQNSLYRLSCQTSIWNRAYFLKYFNHDWSPWQLELAGSQLAQGDGWDIVGTNNRWAFSWQEESALSGRWPNHVNILGIAPEDVRYAIDQRWLNPAQLQYGIWYECRIPFISRFQGISKRLTKIPQFSEIGYKFKWHIIRPYVRSKTFRRLYNRYKGIYTEI